MCEEYETREQRELRLKQEEDNYPPKNETVFNNKP